MAFTCTFTTLAGTRDLPFIGLTIPHLLAACRHPFQERILVLDRSPVQGSKPPEVTPPEIDALLRQGLLDRVILLDSQYPGGEAVGKLFFGTRRAPSRDYRNLPLLGWATALYEAKTDYVVHFDSDMLLYQSPGHDWISEGIALLENDSSVMFVAPLPGPPTVDGTLRGQQVPPVRDSEGNFRFKTFSSRRFLVSRSRLRALLPTHLKYLSRRRRVFGALTGRSAVLPWESHIDAALRRSSYFRVHLASPRAWTLHNPSRGPEWLACLPRLIALVEQGCFPSAQAGYYDLALEQWQELLR